MKIILADDHNMVLSGLKSLLEQECFNVTTVNSYTHLKTALMADPYDVLLLDIKLGNIDSREYITEIKNISVNLKIIALTSLGDADSIKSTLAAGVDAYLIKSDDVSEIKQAISDVMQGQKYISNAVKARYIEGDLLRTKKGTVHLTPREKDILHLIMNEKTTKEIAETLFLSEKTVENYRSNMMSKLDVKNLAGLVKKAIMDGLLH